MPITTIIDGIDEDDVRFVRFRDRNIRVSVRTRGGIVLAEFRSGYSLDRPMQDIQHYYEAHIIAGGKPDLLADLAGLDYAISDTLGGFLALHRLALKNGGRAVFCNVDPNVAEVFRVCRLTPMFMFAADRPAALALLAGPGPALPTTPPDSTP